MGNETTTQGSDEPNNSESDILVKIDQFSIQKLTTHSYSTIFPPHSKFFKTTNSLVISNVFAVLKNDLKSDIKLAFLQLQAQLQLNSFEKSEIAMVRLYISNLDQY